MRVLILSLLCFPKLTMNVYHFCEPRDKRMNICPNSMFKKIFFALSLSERSILEIFPKKKKCSWFLWLTVNVRLLLVAATLSHLVPFPLSLLPFHTNQGLLEFDPEPALQHGISGPGVGLATVFWICGPFLRCSR